MTTHRIRTRNDAVDPGLVPPVLMVWLSIFRDCFTAPVWDHVLVLVAGAVLAPGKRTVSQVLRSWDWRRNQASLATMRC